MMPLIQRGIAALLQHDIPGAYSAFASAYHATDWMIRDMAVTGLGDLLDPRFYEGSRLPSVAIAADWQPEETLPVQAKITAGRLPVLVDGFLQRAVLQPESIAEQKTLHALRSALALLENALLNDSHHLVRFSALMLLTTLLDEERRSFILPTLGRASQREQNDLMREALLRFL